MPRWRIKDEKPILVEQTRISEGVSVRRFRFRLTSQPEAPAEIESHMVVEGDLALPRAGAQEGTEAVDLTPEAADNETANDETDITTASTNEQRPE